MSPFEEKNFPIPDVITPTGTVCVTIQWPDDPDHLAILYGLLDTVSRWNYWQPDDAHSGKVLAALYKEVMKTFEIRNICCPAGTPGGCEIEEQMPIRVDCNCNVFVTCCDGTEVQLATVPMLNAPGQPGSGSKQPGPGQTACYQANMNASDMFLVPTPVSTGDVITIQSGAGAVSNSHDPTWRCINGQQYFAGACVSTGRSFPGDPVPSAFGSTLMINIAGTFYSLASGTFTVPSGVSNVQPTIQVNDASIAGLAGSYSFQVCVQNNHASSSGWTHSADFTLSDDGWQTFVLPPGCVGAAGQWEAGIGWVGTDWTSQLGQFFQCVDIHHSLVSTTYTRVELHYEYTPSSPADTPFASIAGGINGQDGLLIEDGTPTSGLLVWNGNHAGNSIDISVYVYQQQNTLPTPGACKITKVIVQGPTGSDPF